MTNWIKLTYLFIDEHSPDEAVARLVIEIVCEDLHDLRRTDADVGVQQVVAYLNIAVVCHHLLWQKSIMIVLSVLLRQLNIL